MFIIVYHSYCEKSKSHARFALIYFSFGPGVLVFKLSYLAVSVRRQTSNRKNRGVHLIIGRLRKIIRGIYILSIHLKFLLFAHELN